MDKVYAVIPAGLVEYSRDEAEVDINEFIEQLERLRDLDGVTHVVGLSGNYRGAQYVRLGEPEYDEDNDEF